MHQPWGRGRQPGGEGLQQAVRLHPRDGDLQEMQRACALIARSVAPSPRLWNMCIS